ncbi:MAG: Crp/Fnr family transcriptional regulator [Tannerella sp.]|jgi:CRP-like cAMP-binding protein|nr:Crp/Fnr family transcriptional regulator [Tannerella sp.]
MDRDVLFFCSFCRHKSAEDLSMMSCSIENVARTYKREEYIAYQGDTVSSMYMLLKGTVKTEIVSDTGMTLSVELIDAPYPLAAAFLFADDHHFPVDIIAVTDCEILVIPKRDVEKQLSACPDFMRSFLTYNANNFLTLSDRLKIFSQKSIKAKIAYYLLQRTKNGSFEMERNVSELAEYFGVERPSLSRAFSEMSRDGIIQFSGKRGKILDHKAMNEIRG